jgi:hypothetical protein
MESDEIVDSIGALFAKYEVPIGMLNKLMELQLFDGMHFMIDDSGSMNSPSDFQGAGREITRWEECQIRMKQMLEILVYIPTPPILITFLNRDKTIQIPRNRNGETPAQLLRRISLEIDSAFRIYPNGQTTPFLRKASESIQNGKGKRIARYFFGDGFRYPNKL